MRGCFANDDKYGKYFLGLKMLKAGVCMGFHVECCMFVYVVRGFLFEFYRALKCVGFEFDRVPKCVGFLYILKTLKSEK